MKEEMQNMNNNESNAQKNIEALRLRRVLPPERGWGENSRVIFIHQGHLHSGRILGRNCNSFETPKCYLIRFDGLQFDIWIQAEEILGHVLQFPDIELIY